MSETLISHVPKLYFSTLQLDYLIICDKDACAAKILKLFEVWASARDEAIEQARYHNAAAQKEGLEPTHDESSWLYNTIPNLERRLLLEHSRKTVIRALKLLEDKGFIISRHNPKYRWDRTKQYQFQTTVVQEAVYEIKPEDLAPWYPDSEPLRRETLDFMHRVNLPYASCKNDPMHRANLHDQSGQNDTINRANLHDDPKSLTKSHSNSQEESPLSPPGDSASEPPPQVVTVEVLEPEPPRETSNEGITDNQTTNQTEALKAKDFGLGQLSAAPPPRTTKKHGITEDDFEALRNLYNEHKPPGWAVWKRSGDKRIRLLRKFCAECGEEAAQTLIDALSFVTNDDWWATRPLGIDTVLRSGKAIELAEKFEAQQAEGSSAAPVRRRQQGTFDYIQQSLNGKPAGAFC